MSVFGPISSIFDFITFFVMLWILHASHNEFRSGWFVESLATQTLVVLLIRTRRVPFITSRPSIAKARFYARDAHPHRAPTTHDERLRRRVARRAAHFTRHAAPRLRL